MREEFNKGLTVKRHAGRLNDSREINQAIYGELCVKHTRNIN